MVELKTDPPGPNPQGWTLSAWPQEQIGGTKVLAKPQELQRPPRICSFPPASRSSGRGSAGLGALLL